ncbi:MAG: transposase, partial [Pseudonocardiaceae bacterium]
MPAVEQYSDEFRQRAVRMVLDGHPEAGGQLEAIERVADQLTVAPQTLHQWVEQAGAKETSESSDATPPAESDTYEEGLLLVQRGELDKAETLWRTAAEAGNTDAATGLGRLLVQRGELAEAEAWWRTAAKTGNIDAANYLGLLLVQRDELAEAETWWRSTAEAGNIAAATVLG